MKKNIEAQVILPQVFVAVIDSLRLNSLIFFVSPNLVYRDRERTGQHQEKSRRDEQEARPNTA